MNQIVYLYKRVHWIFYTLLSLVMAVVLLMMVHYEWWWWYIVVVDKFLVLTACSRKPPLCTTILIPKICKKKYSRWRKNHSKKAFRFQKNANASRFRLSKITIICPCANKVHLHIMIIHTYYMSERTSGKFCESTKYSHTCLSTFF